MLVLVASAMVGAANAERLRTPSGEVKDVPAESVEFAIRDGYSRIPSVLMRDSSGTVREVYEDLAPLAEVERGWWRMTEREVAAYRAAEYERRSAQIAREVREERYGGAGGAIKAGIIGFLRGATVGLSDLVYFWIEGYYGLDVLDAYRKEHPQASAISKWVGVAGFLTILYFAARRLHRWWLRGAPG